MHFQVEVVNEVDHDQVLDQVAGGVAQWHKHFKSDDNQCRRQELDENVETRLRCQILLGRLTVTGDEDPAQKQVSDYVKPVFVVVW